MPEHAYFSAETSLSTRAFYAVLCLITLVYSLIGLFSPLLAPRCDIPLLDKDPFRRRLVQGLEGGLEDAPNPSYRPDPCRWRRYGVLLGLNKWEAEMCCRVIISILMGSIIGFERRRADRPAGIRTMAMVCLGACVFTIDSMFAFVDGTMGWDASHGRMGKAPSCRWRRLLPWPAREASASGPGCSTHSGRAPRLLRPQWQQMVLPSACARVAHSAPFHPPGV